MQPRVEIGNKERIELRMPYSQQGVTLCRSINGGRWVKADGCWSFPLTWTTCLHLRETFPDLVIGPNLWEWAKEEKKQQAGRVRYHRAQEDYVDLPVVREQFPTMWEALKERGYQTLIPAFAAEVGNFFNASQPGTGKTIETLATLAELQIGQRVLIVAPRKAIQVTWPKEIEKWLCPDAAVGYLLCDDSVGNMSERNEALEEYANSASDARWEFVLIHPEMLSWKFTCPDGLCKTGKSRQCEGRKKHTKTPMYPALYNISWDAIVMDETHKFMMHGNERSGTVSGWGYGAQKLKTAPGSLKIGMAGTPFKGKERKFWPVLHWMHPERYPGQRKWEFTYFETETGWMGREQATDILREDRRSLFETDIASLMIRHTKKELREINPNWAPPEKLHVDVALPMDPKQKRAYGQMVKDASAQLADGMLDAVGILAERTRLKQLANHFGRMENEEFIPALPSNKWDWLLDALEERGLEPQRHIGRNFIPALNEGDSKIVIASQYVSTLQLFAMELDLAGINFFEIYGKTKDTERIEREWQSPQTETRVLLLSIAAGGYSLTLDAADDLVLIDHPENPDDVEQVEDRVHRTSRTDHQVTIYHLYSLDTIEEAIATGNLLMDATQKAVLDGRRGVEYARKVLEGR